MNGEEHDVTREDVEFAANYDWKSVSASIVVSDPIVAPIRSAPHRRWAWLARPVRAVSDALYGLADKLEDMAGRVGLWAYRLRGHCPPAAGMLGEIVQATLQAKSGQLAASIFAENPLIGGINRESASYWKDGCVTVKGVPIEPD